MAKQTVPAKTSGLTAEQVSMAMEEITMQLQALERVSIMLQCELLQDDRDRDAMHTITRSVLQSASFIAEKVAKGVNPAAGIGGDDPLEWFMPALFFHDNNDVGQEVQV